MKPIDLENLGLRSYIRARLRVDLKSLLFYNCVCQFYNIAYCYKLLLSRIYLKDKTMNGHCFILSLSLSIILYPSKLVYVDLRLLEFLIKLSIIAIKHNSVIFFMIYIVL